LDFGLTTQVRDHFRKAQRDAVEKQILATP
jgi:hypothetical protein